MLNSVKNNQVNMVTSQLMGHKKGAWEKKISARTNSNCDVTKILWNMVKEIQGKTKNKNGQIYLL